LLCKETGGDFAMPGSSQLRRADEGVRVLATRRGIALRVAKTQAERRVLCGVARTQDFVQAESSTKGIWCVDDVTKLFFNFAQKSLSLNIKERIKCKEMLVG